MAEESEPLKFQIIPRKVCIVLLRQNGEYEVSLTDSLRKNKSIELEDLEASVTGFSPYAGMKLESPTLHPEFLVLSKFQIMKDKYVVYELHNFHRFERGLIFEPQKPGDASLAKVFPIDNIRNKTALLGKWKVLVKVAFLLRTSIPLNPQEEFYRDIQFVDVQSFKWKVTSPFGNLVKDGDLEKGTLFDADKDKRVNLEQI